LFVPTIPFDPQRRLIQIAALASDGRRLVLQMLVDTGASMTGLRASALLALGIDPQTAERTLQLNTASGTMSVPVVIVPNLHVFGVSLVNVPVLCLPLPAAVGADGVLGNDVLSHFWLFVHFRRGLLVAEQVSNFWRRWRFWWQVMRAS